jgi:hypothetical protein
MTVTVSRATSKIEALAAANLKPMAANPCLIWDEMVAARMVRDGCDRSAATDRLLGTPQGSDAWLQCQAWDAQQPKVIEQHGRKIKTGNWLNAGDGIARRIPRAP